MEDCVFCKIVKGKLPTVIETESENVVSFNSIEPAAEIHILIVPKKHIPTFLYTATANDKTLSEMAIVAKRLIESKKIAEGYKLVFNGGVYQSVPHLHWHLLGGKLNENWRDKI